MLLLCSSQLRARRVLPIKRTFAEAHVAKANKLPRVYPQGVSQQPPEYWDYTKLDLEIEPGADYEKLFKLGKGKYSEVYEASLVEDESETFVMKIFERKNLEPIKREVKVLQVLDHPNISKLHSVIQLPETEQYALVFESNHGTDLKKTFRSLTPLSLRYYLFELLKALDYAHSRGVMHRDIKLGNIVVEPETHSLEIIDWGHADFYVPGKEYSLRVATLHYKAPELLVGKRTYDYSVDMWAVGCLLASVLFQRVPFFDSQSLETHLSTIVRVLGTQNFDRWLQKEGIQLDPEVRKELGHWNKSGWLQYINPTNAKWVTEDALDLLDRLLRYDPEERLTAREAMGHPFFHKYQAPKQTQAKEETRVE